MYFWDEMMCKSRVDWAILALLAVLYFAIFSLACAAFAMAV
jgi:hypothetical protein